MIELSHKKITRESLLEYNSEETYIARYTGIVPARGMFKSPFRQDNHPSCSFYKANNGKIYLKDFSRNEYTCDFVKAAMIRYGLTDYHEALRMIAEDFGIIKMPVKREIKTFEIEISDKVFKKNGLTDIRVKVFDDFEERHLEYWGRYGIGKDELKKFRVYPIERLFINGKEIMFGNKLCFGYFYSYLIDEKGRRIEFWRIYFPGQKKMRFVSNWRKDMIQGWKQLPDTGNILVVTKSLKDVICMSKFGINAIAPCSESMFISDEMLAKIKKRFKSVVVMYDNDRAGLSSMIKIKKEHPDLTFVWIPKRYGCKDFSDLYEMYGKEMSDIVEAAKIMILSKISKNKIKSRQYEIAKSIFKRGNECRLISSEE